MVALCVERMGTFFMTEPKKVYNLPTCKGFKIKQDIFIIKNGKTLKMKFSELSTDLNKVLINNG